MILLWIIPVGLSVMENKLISGMIVGALNVSFMRWLVFLVGSDRNFLLKSVKLGVNSWFISLLPSNMSELDNLKNLVIF